MGDGTVKVFPTPAQINKESVRTKMDTLRELFFHKLLNVPSSLNWFQYFD